MNKTRISITLPPQIVSEIDRTVSNRSRFVLDAIVRELDRRRRERLQESLDQPHPESAEIAEEGFEEWYAELPEAEDLLVRDGGTSVRWRSGEGWTGEVE